MRSEGLCIVRGCTLTRPVRDKVVVVVTLSIVHLWKPLNIWFRRRSHDTHRFADDVCLQQAIGVQVIGQHPRVRAPIRERQALRRVLRERKRLPRARIRRGDLLQLASASGVLVGREARLTP